jgi:hypothetical protein
MTTQEITKIVNNLKFGESKRLSNGAEVYCDSYTDWGYSVVSPDGDTCKTFISKQHAINLLSTKEANEE